MVKKCISLIMAALLLAGLAACAAPQQQPAGSQPAQESSGPSEEYTLPLEDGYNQVTFY